MIVHRPRQRLAASFASLALRVIGTAVASTAVAQEPAFHARLDPAVRSEVDAAIATAKARGLPTEPIIDKALEGTAKRAPTPRIIAAVRTLASGLATAQSELGEVSGPSDLVAGAEALRAGVEPSALSRLRRARPLESLLVPLVVLSDLISRGVPPTSAADAILELANRGASDTDFGVMQREVLHDIQAGAPPADAAAVRSRGWSDLRDGSIERPAGEPRGRNRGGDGKGDAKPPKSGQNSPKSKAPDQAPVKPPRAGPKAPGNTNGAKPDKPHKYSPKGKPSKDYRSRPGRD